MKKILRSGSAKDKLDKVYSVLYSYSHIKFNDFMATPEIRVIVNIICDKLGKANLIQNNAALSANREKYEAHINRLLRSFK